MISLFPVRIRMWAALLLICGQANPLYSLSKPHVIAFGKWTTVSWSPLGGTAEEKPIALKVRPLVIDGRIREFTLGLPHDITDRLFVIQRVFRINDSLPQEPATPQHWQWERGGWLLVDRVTGHVSPINLPEFDTFYSGASWYRDYAAYCGVSEDGKKIYAVVAQVSRRKPVLKKILDGRNIVGGDVKNSLPDSACPAPEWQRFPVRVSFESSGAAKETFAIRGHVVDLRTEEDEEEAVK